MRMDSSGRVSELVDEVRLRLAAAGDPVKAPQMQAYMKSAMPFRGVTAVPMRKISREVFAAHRLADRGEWEGAVRELWDHAEYREERYAALELTGHRFYRVHQDVATLELYLHLVTTGAWWDYVDAIASRRAGPILRADFASVEPLVRSWAEDDDLWVRRTAILCQLGSKNTTDVDLLRFVIEQNLERSRFGHEFFIRKAIGWALREHAKTDPEWVIGLVISTGSTSRLAPLSRREALKNIERSATAGSGQERDHT